MVLHMRFERSHDDLFTRSAERLVLTGLRCWMPGYEHGDIQCWETAWRQYSSALGARNGRLLLSELQYWVRVLRDVSARQISFYPYCCRHVCADECIHRVPLVVRWPGVGARKPVFTLPRNATASVASTRNETLPVALPPKSSKFS